MVDVCGRHEPATFLRGTAIELQSLGEMPWVSFLLDAISIGTFPPSVLHTSSHAGLYGTGPLSIFLEVMGKEQVGEVLVG